MSEKPLYLNAQDMSLQAQLPEETVSVSYLSDDSLDDEVRFSKRFTLQY